MDTTNPDLVDVADETYGNPDPNGGTSSWRPRELDLLSDPSAQGYPPAPVDFSLYPTPVEEIVDEAAPPAETDAVAVPDATEIYVDEQSLGTGGMVPNDPADPSAGMSFRSPDEFVVVGPTETFQTNRTETVEVAATVLAVLDADNLPNAPGAATTRYYLRVVTPPQLTSFPVSLLGRQIVFADDTATAADRGAARTITGYGTNFVVVNKSDPTENNGDVPVLADPAPGDVFTLFVGRQGSEDVATTSAAPTNVFLLPESLPFEANLPQSLKDRGDVFVSEEIPFDPYVGSGTPAPLSTNSYPADQYVGGPGLPANVFA